MKYYIMFGLLFAVFLLLWFTKDVNAQVKASKDAVINYRVVAIANAMKYQCITVEDPGIETRCAKIR